MKIKITRTVYFQLWIRYVVNITSIDFLRYIFPQHKLHTNVHAEASRTTTTGESTNHCSFNKLIIIIIIIIINIVIITTTVIILISKNWTRSASQSLDSPPSHTAAVYGNPALFSCRKAPKRSLIHPGNGWQTPWQPLRRESLPDN